MSEVVSNFYKFNQKEKPEKLRRKEVRKNGTAVISEAELMRLQA